MNWRFALALRGDHAGVRKLLAVLPVLVALAAGCGGGGDTLSAEEYRTQADEICGKANEKLDALGEPESLEEFRSLIEESRPTVEGAVEDLGELEPPEDLEDAHERWMAENEQLLETLDELESVEDEQELQQLGERFTKENEQANQIAREDLGLETCAEDE
jgi:hypothetical protein